MLNSYITRKKIKEKRKESINNYIFGLTFGLSIILIFFFSFLNTSINLLSYIDILIIIYGLICVISATINPNSRILVFIKKVNLKIFNTIGELILKGILIIVYTIFVIPAGLYMQNKIKQENKDTNFIEYENSYNIKLGKYKYLKIFKLFSSDYFYLLPLIIILVIISFLVVLITSSVFTPLIYTLF